MERFAALLVVALLASCTNAVGQTFSTDADYAVFYKTHFNPKFESSSEPAVALWWTIEQFGDADTPLLKLRDYLARHAKLYPNSRHAAHVASYLQVVERMLGEQRPAAENRIERLIFDLRDLNHDYGHVVGPRPSYKGPDGDPLPVEIIAQIETSNDAADHLRDIGYDCVPALIDHIDDDTLTRTRLVSSWRYSPVSDRVLTVGECCRRILGLILPTARQFELGNNSKATKLAMKNHYLHLIAQKRAEQ